MSILRKIVDGLVKFVKENRIVTFAIGAVALSFILLAIPGQFAHVGLLSNDPLYTLSGYEYIFNAKTTKITYETVYLGQKISGLGLAGMIVMFLAAIGLVISRKSSFFTMVCGLGLLTVSVFFYAMEANAYTIYSQMYWIEDTPFIQWASYVIASLLVVSAGLVIYKSVLMFKDEIKHPVQQKGPYYNYLKK